MYSGILIIIIWFQRMYGEIQVQLPNKKIDYFSLAMVLNNFTISVHLDQSSLTHSFSISDFEK